MECRTARALTSALITNGVQAVSIKEQIDAAISSSLGFLRIFRAFLGLGLFVGIASLGVIALRSVVERRRQIGMLRVIGYQRGSVALRFILESSVIALMGIVAGILDATLLSWRLIEGGALTGVSNIAFLMPWTEIMVESVLAFGFALVMTWWPSRQAAGVLIADALRYE